MIKNIIEIKKCQMCGNKNLTTYLDLGLSPLANFLKNTVDEQEFLAPLEVVKCENEKCSCFQLKHLVNPEILFSSYNYRSSIALQKHFKEYAEHTYKLLNLKKNDLMVGIGGNIGQIESVYNDLGLKSINIESAQNIAFESRKNGVETITEFFNTKVANDIISKYGKAKIICANNVMCHCPINQVFEGIKTLLDKDGIFVSESCYWLKSIEQKDLFQIYSEHYRYATVKSYVNYFNQQGFDVFRIEHNNIQLGTIRVYVKSRKNKSFEIDKSVQESIKNEEDFGLYKKETYDLIYSQLFQIGVQLQTILQNLKSEGKKIGLFGVAAKTVLMLKYFGISKHFDYATDDSSLKFNHFIPGTSIKIISKEEFWAQKLDYVIPIYNFFDLIVEKNRDKNVKWIRNLPYLEII